VQIEFTKHAIEQMEFRNMLQHEIVEVIQFPDKIIKKHGKYYFQKYTRGQIEVVCERTESIIKVITVYWL
jgi:hypothetical protein